jgi:hypothetical protein
MAEAIPSPGRVFLPASACWRQLQQFGGPYHGTPRENIQGTRPMNNCSPTIRKRANRHAGERRQTAVRMTAPSSPRCLQFITYSPQHFSLLGSSSVQHFGSQSHLQQQQQQQEQLSFVSSGINLTSFLLHIEDCLCVGAKLFALTSTNGFAGPFVRRECEQQFSAARNHSLLVKPVEHPLAISAAFHESSFSEHG